MNKIMYKGNVYVLASNNIDYLAISILFEGGGDDSGEFRDDLIREVMPYINKSKIGDPNQEMSDTDWNMAVKWLVWDASDVTVEKAKKIFHEVIKKFDGEVEINTLPPELGEASGKKAVVIHLSRGEEDFEEE